ncbi:MAG: aminopeptidase P family protein [bacterium]
MKIHLQNRIKKIKQIININFLISNLKNIQYLTGFTGNWAKILITPEKNFFFTNSCYYEEVKNKIKNFEIILCKNSLADSLKNIFKKFKIKKLYFEENYFSYQEYKNLSQQLHSIKFIPSNNLIEKIREVKDDDEIKLLKKAAKIGDKAFQYLLNFIKPDLKEIEVSIELDYFIKKNGGDKIPFDYIIAFGKNCAYPHATATNKKLKKDEMILFDFGVNYKAYNSDITRTIFLGKASEKYKKIYNIVLSAQKIVLEKIKPNIECGKLDLLARNFIDKQGFGKYFIHGLGHGIGLDVHENPYLSKQNNERLKENTVVTIEPGIYIPGWGGIRIEDMVFLGKNKIEILTKSPKEMIEL